MKRKLIAAAIITCSLLTTATIANSIAFHNTKKACIENHKTPIAKKDFLAFNWSVICH